MGLGEELLAAFAPSSFGPLRGREAVDGLCLRGQRNGGEVLEQADEHKTHLVVRKLDKM